MKMTLIDRRFPANSLPILAGLRFDDECAWSGVTEEKRYAVLLLFVPPARGSDNARLVLTKRAHHLRSHRGQISLAGGQANEEDRTAAETAMREAREELDLPDDSVIVHGTLTPTKALNGGLVVPVVATAAILPEALTPNHHEVAEVYFTPWQELCPEASSEFEFNVFGQWRHSFYFGRGEPKVWGLTAQILAHASFRPHGS